MKSEKQKKHLVKLAQLRVGTIHSYETRNKISEATKGRRAWNKGVPMSEEQKQKLRKPRPSNQGEKNYIWKGNQAGYAALHIWVKRTFGKPHLCEHCNRKREESDFKIFDWANISGTYRRERSDWKMLCKSCHKYYDNSKRKCKIKRKSPTKETREKISLGLKKHFASV